MCPIDSCSPLSFPSPPPWRVPVAFRQHCTTVGRLGGKGRRVGNKNLWDTFRCLPSQHSRASCSVSMKLCSSELVSEFWVLSWLHYGLRDCLLWFQLFCICWGVLYLQLCGRFWSRFNVVLKRMYILWIWGGEFCRCLSGLFVPGLSSSPGYPC